MEDAVELAERLLLVDFSADYQAPRSVQPAAAAGQSRPGSRSVTPPRAAVQAARDLCQRIGDAATSKKAVSGPAPSHLVSLKLPTQLAAPQQQPQHQLQPNVTQTPTRCGSMTARDRYGSQAAAVALSPVRPAGQLLAAAPAASPGFMTARGPRTSSGGGAHQLGMRTSLDTALPLQQPSPARPAQQQQQQPARSQARSSSHIPYGAAAAAANMLAQAIGAAKPAKPAGTPPRAPYGSAKPAAAADASGADVPSLLLSRLSGQQPGQASTGGGSGGVVTVIGGALGSPLSPSRSAAAQTGSPLTSRQRGSSVTASSITLAPHSSGALTARSPRTPSLLGLQAAVAVAGVTLPAEQPPLSARPRHPAEAEADAAKGGKLSLQLQLPPREEVSKELGGKQQQQPPAGGAGPRGIVPGLRLGSIAR
ncbi:hypothetical protein HYH02_005460 [Chlamydomonas schloesseri]|nr:hypothetical protein HYH02_005460 [Chlamydomonas schloesseri]|eukprot:KAG2449304.1 hypothetical protein HYH02_005460 [Chlamydomonas schloesseri]